MFLSSVKENREVINIISLFLGEHGHRWNTSRTARNLVLNQPLYCRQITNKWSLKGFIYPFATLISSYLTKNKVPFRRLVYLLSSKLL